MSSQVFYRQWRPQTFADVVGQEHVTRTLLNALQSGRVAHAYLFCGPRGTGKTSTGRILAKAVNCLTSGKGEPCNTCSMCTGITQGSALDLLEVDAASNRGIEEIRELRERARFAPHAARKRVYIIDEVHMLTDAAANALLKTLEEPPPYVIFVLATTEPHKLLPTLISRCQRFDFHRLSLADIVEQLARISQKEGIDIPPEALKLIARSASGSLRDAENVLEQVVAYYGLKVDLSQVKATLGVTADARTKELARQILNKDIKAGLTTINSLNADGLDLKGFTRELVEYLRQLLLIKAGSAEATEFTTDEASDARDMVAKPSLDHILKAVQLFSRIDLRLDSYSSLPLEMSLVESCLAPEETGRTTAPPPAPRGRVADSAPRVPREAGRPPAAPVAAAKPKPAAPVPPPVEKPIERPRPAALSVTPKPAAPALTEETRPAAPLASPIPSDMSSLDSGDFVSQLRAEWKKVLESSRGTDRTVEALLRNSCEPVAIEDNTVVLAVYYPYHKDKLEEVEKKHTVESIVSKTLGAPFRVRYVLKTRDKQELAQGHLVRAAIEQGGRIVK